MLHNAIITAHCDNYAMTATNTLFGQNVSAVFTVNAGGAQRDHSALNTFFNTVAQIWTTCCNIQQLLDHTGSMDHMTQNSVHISEQH
jgi:hypothetical protein